MRTGRQIDVSALPADTRPARRFRVQPTITGVVLTVAVVLFVAIAPQVADPDMAGFVWAAALGVLIVGAAWPCAAVWLVSVQPIGPSVHRWRSQLRVGESTGVPVRLGPRLSEVRLRWVDSTDVTNVGAGAGCDVEVPLTAVRRGRFPTLTLWVETDAPFGIVRAARAVTVHLDVPLEVGPRRIPVEALVPTDVGLVGALATTSTGHGGDTTRSVRPYVTGDPAHLVHWPTSARTGELVVREMEPPADMAVAVVLDLGAVRVDGVAAGGGGRGLPLMPTTPLAEGEDRAVEGAVARASAVVEDLRARGVRVLLCTSEGTGASGGTGTSGGMGASEGTGASGGTGISGGTGTSDGRPQVGEVGDDAVTTSRLAGAVPGPPGVVPPGWSVLRITPRGDDA